MAGLLIIIFYGLMILRIYAFLTGRRKEAVHHGGIVWASALFMMIGIRIRREGLDNITGYKNYVFASNHASVLDILALAASIPIKFVFVMDDQLFKIPFFGSYNRFAGNLPVSRIDPKQARQDMQNIVSCLSQGESIVIFGEGGRSRDGKLHNFKSGVGVLAGESGVPVIPVAISGSYNLMRRRSIIIDPGEILVNFGAPIKFGPDEPPIRIAAAVHDKVEEMLKS